MRYIPKIILLSFLFVSSVFEQDAACPTVSVDGPPDLPTKDKPERFVVNISGKVMGKPLFAWTISTGAIIKGHGTSEILVSRDNYGEALTATVEVSDLGPNCPVVRASATSEIAIDPTFELFDEYDRLSWRNQQKRLSLAFAKLSMNKDSTLAIMLTDSDKLPRLRRVLSYLRSIDQDLASGLIFRVSAKHIPTRIYIVPPGIESPICEAKCITVYAKDVRY